MKERYGAKNPRSWMMRFHTQTAGCSLTAQEPENNIVRTAIEALAAVLGGTQSLHTNSMDEVLALPTEKAVKIALRTQQIIAYESGAANTIDPLAGSYFIEALTNEMEAAAEEYFRKIEALGGVLAAIEKGFFQQEIADAAYAYQQAIEMGERVVVGVNRFASGEPLNIELLKIDPAVERRQVERLQKLKERRDNIAVAGALQRLAKAASGSENLIPFILEAAKLYATEGEIIGTLKEVFGEYRERPIF
jgi:methylmalonyl-CoA mutase N-terminal domain/subunit